MKNTQYIKGYDRAIEDYTNKGYDYCLKIYNYYTENLGFRSFAVLADHVEGYCDSFKTIMLEKGKQQWKAN